MSSALLGRPLKLDLLTLGSFELAAEIEANPALTLTKGDLLRVSFQAENLVLLLMIDRIEPGEQRRLKVSGTRQSWFEPFKGLEREENPTVYRFSPGADNGQPISTNRPARFDAAKAQVVLTLNLSLAEAPDLATLLRLDSEEVGQGWLSVQEVRAANTPGSIEVAGTAFRWRKNGPTILPSTLPENLEVERLSFELWARRGADNPARLSDLTFGAEHPHFWGALPNDEQLYGEADSEAADRHSEIWQEAAHPRFLLAGGGGRLFLPLFVSSLPQEFSPPFEDKATTLERDGLSDFSESLFLDPELAGIGTADLVAQADFLRYQGLNPRRLEGLHSLLSLEEVTILALPDAVQRGWSSFSPPPQPPVQPSPPLAHLDRVRCPSPDQSNAAPDGSEFLECDILIIEPPANLRCDTPDPTHRVLTQVNLSDLAFLRERLRAVDAELWLEGSTLHAQARSRRNGGSVQLAYRQALREFSVIADLAGQRTSVTASGWDVSSKAALSYEASASVISGELGNDQSGVSVLSSAFGPHKETLAHTVPFTGDEIRARAEAFFKMSARRFVVGRGVTEADGRLKVGSFVNLLDLGKLFSGKYYLVEVQHLFDSANGLRTEFTGERPGIGQ